jgi:type I restriction enzyme S subunit
MNWVSTRLKHVVRINPEILGEDTPADREFRYIDIGATGRGKLETEPVRMTFAEAPSRARRVLAPGDTIISTVRTYLRAVWTLTTRDRDLVGSTGFACLRPSARIDAAFLGWLAQSDAVVEEVVARSVGVSYPAINPAAIGMIKVALPSMARQRAIAEYLDREAANIDALIEKLGRELQVLRERRQALITAAVTGQLNISKNA